MKLLTALKRLPADNCVVLTYNADLLFFEYMVFEPIYAAGCRNTLVLCDPTQYELALADTPLLRYAGQRYVLLPARTSLSGAFHPKIVFLTSTDGGRLFVTSGNLTRAGYARNWEVVTCFEYNAKKPDPTAWAACRWAFDTLSQIVTASDVGKLAYQRLDQLLGTTPWLRQESPLSPSAQLWLLHNLDEPLLDQMVARYRKDDGSPISDAVIVSPFFDAGARAIDKMLAECQPRRLNLYTQGIEGGLNPRALSAVLKRHGSDFQACQLDLDGRRLHAKSLLMRSEQGVWLATGSANFSAPAWLHRAATGNTEIIALRFEPDPTHFDPWLDELIVGAHPLELDWDIEPSTDEPPQATTAAPLTLLSAILDKGRLAIHLAERLPTDASLTVRLAGEEPLETIYKRWQQQADRTLTLRLSSELLPHLEGPILVTLEAVSSSDKLWSNPVLLNNLGALRRFSRPVQRRERPHIPEGIIPESYEHCAQLLEMIHDLLATNSEQLRRHRGRITALTKTDRQERQMAVEEEGDYDPEEHFVDEQVRLAASSTGADLYADFYDRLTYEELLRAALAAVFHPVPAPTEGREPGEPPSIAPPPAPEPVPPPDSEALRAKMMARIKQGFKRLVGNFAKGATDADYLAQVPPRYLLELFAIVTAYLRVVWRDGMLGKNPFVDLSLELLTALWGRPGHPGAWEVLRSRLTDAEREQEKARLALGAQAWLHAYVTAQVLAQADDRRVYDLAAWMRQFWAALDGPDTLKALPDYAYRRLWRASFPRTVEFRSASEVVSHLQVASQGYDETSLLAEIATWPGARASTSLGAVAYLKDVPRLETTLPLSNADLDRCLRAFILFLTWPQPKQVAWTRFTNANPLADADDLECLTIFYRSDKHLLVFAVRRASGYHRPDFDITGVTVEELGRIRSVAELHALRPT